MKFLSKLFLPAITPLYYLSINLNITNNLPNNFNPQISINETIKGLNKKVWMYHEQKNDSALFFAQKAVDFTSKTTKTQDLFIAYIQIAEIYRTEKKIKLAKQYLTKASNIINKISSLENKGRYFLYQGRLAYLQKKYESAKEFLRKGIEINYQTRYPFIIDLLMYLSKVAVKEQHYLEAIDYLKEALELAEQLKKSKKSSLLNNLGNIYAEQQQYEKAKSYYNQSIEAAKLESNAKAESRAYLNIGNIFYFQGSWNEAIFWYLESVKLKTSFHDYNGIAKIHNNIAAIYKQHKRYEESLRYFDMGESYFSSIKDSIKLAETWMNKAVIITLLKKPDQALILLHKAEIVFKNNKLEKNLQLAEYNIALSLTKLKKYKKAIEYLKLAEKKASKLNEKHSLIYITNLFGVCYFELRKYNLALPFYEKSYVLSKELGVLNEQKTALFGLFETTETLGYFNKSLKWHKQYSSIKDSLFNIASAAELMTLQEMYEAKQKEQKILALKATNEKVLLENTIKNGQLKTSLLLTALGILTTIGISLLLYVRSKSQKAILLHTHEKNKEQINHLMQQQQIQTLETVLKTQETERKKIAKDIHDNLGSYLATMKYQHEAHKPYLTQNSERTIYENMSQLIEDTYAEVRSISHRMATGQSFDFSLCNEIEKSLNRIKAINQINVLFENLTDNFQLSQEVEFEIYKVLQELLSNLLKHSKATELIMQINNDKDYLSIIIEDNGIGFNSKEESKGIGISNISSRIKKCNGQIEINSAIGKGTTTLIRIPLTKTIEYEY